VLFDTGDIHVCPSKVFFFVSCYKTSHLDSKLDNKILSYIQINMIHFCELVFKVKDEEAS